MKVTSKGDGDRPKVEYKKFKILAQMMDASGSWSYQLCDPKDGKVYEGDKWFREATLRAAID
jgi:uncharacterized protein (DUF2147 family)